MSRSRRAMASRTDMSRPSSPRGRQTLHRTDDLRVRAATAEIVGERRLDLRRRRFGDLVQERLGLHDHSVQAITALGGLLFDEGALHRMRIVARAESFQGDDLAVADS